MKTVAFVPIRLNSVPWAESDSSPRSSRDWLLPPDRSPNGAVPSQGIQVLPLSKENSTPDSSGGVVSLSSTSRAVLGPALAIRMV